jgi:hypothetical protein
MTNETKPPAVPCGAERVLELSFEDLRATNKARCESAFHQVDEWKPWEWSNAMSGEVGETCAELLTLVTALSAHAGAVSNLTKKMNRVWPANQFKQNWNKPEDQRLDELAERVAGEVADVVIYADLLLTSIGQSLAASVVEKFNAKSDEIGSSVRLRSWDALQAAPASPPLSDELRRIVDVIDRNLNYRRGQRPVGWRDLLAFVDKLAALRAAPGEIGTEQLCDALADAELPVCATHLDAEFVCPECFKAELRAAPGAGREKGNDEAKETESLHPVRIAERRHEAAEEEVFTLPNAKAVGSLHEER